MRATIRNSSGNIEVLSFSDYYPHGSKLPARNFVASISSRHNNYQGQEKDEETGFLNFELRQYDPRIGRWFNPDPMGQYHSPYMAMGNNPISVIDPTGGEGVSGEAGGDDPNATNNMYNPLSKTIAQGGSNNNWWASWNSQNQFAPGLDAFENKINADDSYRSDLHAYWAYKDAHYNELATKKWTKS